MEDKINIAKEAVGFLMRKGKEFDKANSRNAGLFYDRAEAVQYLIFKLENIPGYRMPNSNVDNEYSKGWNAHYDACLSDCQPKEPN